MVGMLALESLGRLMHTLQPDEQDLLMESGCNPLHNKTIRPPCKAETLSKSIGWYGGRDIKL